MSSARVPRQTAPTKSPRTVSTPNVLYTMRALFDNVQHEYQQPKRLKAEGKLPAGLRGVLYANGPGRTDVHGDRNRHWFDCDGMIHALRIDDAGVSYQNRFVETRGKSLEDRMGRLVCSNFGRRATLGPVGKQLWGGKNPANTHIVKHQGALWALCEAGRPYAIDPDTLETLGEDDLGGLLGPKDRLSAHPKLHPTSGELWNFGPVYGKRNVLRVFRRDLRGITHEHCEVPMPFPGMIHDFALSRSKAVFIFAPLALPKFPVQLMVGTKALTDSLRWQPELGTHIAVVDLASGEVSWHVAEPFMLFHTVNAFDEDRGGVVVDAVTYEDASFMQAPMHMMQGLPPDHAPARLTRLRLRWGGAVDMRVRNSITMEFPRVMGHEMGREHRYVYGCAYAQQPFLAGRLVRYDLSRSRLEELPCEPYEFAGEPQLVRTGNGDTYVLSVVRDVAHDVTKLHVYDAAELEQGPMYVAYLPQMLPLGFHGSWIGAAGPANGV